MSEKLDRCHCTVPGHGQDCIVAHEIRQQQQDLRTRRRRARDRAAVTEQVGEAGDLLE